MNAQALLNALRFYFITDDGAPGHSPVEQVKTALLGGATMVQYRHKGFSEEFLSEAIEIRGICRKMNVPLIVNDHIALAKRISADGVHLGQEDAAAAEARKTMGSAAIIGISVSTLEELAQTDLSSCDYVGSGPVFPTGTKADAKAVRGLGGLREIVERSPLPVVAIGGITPANAAGCFGAGAAGVAVISCVSRAEDPLDSARQLANACGVSRIR